MARIVRLMTMAIGFSASVDDGGYGSSAKIAQLQDLSQNIGALLLECGEGISQMTPPNRRERLRSDQSNILPQTLPGMTCGPAPS